MKKFPKKCRESSYWWSEQTYKTQSEGDTIKTIFLASSRAGKIEIPKDGLKLMVEDIFKEES